MRPAQALLDEWNRRLAADGFRDIEPVENALLSGSKSGVTTSAQEHAEGAALTDVRRAFLESHRFRRTRDRDIWRLRCEGAYAREIARALGLPLSTVGDVLADLEARALQACQTSGKDGKPKWQKKRGGRRHRPVNVALRKVRAIDPETFLSLAPTLTLGLALRRRF